MKMTVTATAGEINDAGHWLEFCEMTGMGEWAMAEGQLDSDEEFTFTLAEARRLGLVSQVYDT